MKVQARMSETGTLVQAASDLDWALVRPVGEKRPVLFCPDSTCGTRLKAIQRRRQSGEKTRYFAFVKNAHCDHHQVSEPFVVPLGSSRRTAPESEEHRWLKDYVLEAAVRADFVDVAQEKALPGGARADVFVPRACRPRTEVQRGPTDIVERSVSYPDVIWLLRACFDELNKRFLFDQPCVQVRISRTDGHGRWVPAEPWLQPSSDVIVRASGTVLARSSNPNSGDPFGYFVTTPIALDLFLTQVWSGRRIWVPRYEAHKFAGWVLASDLELYRAWLDEPKPAPSTPGISSPLVQDAGSEGQLAPTGSPTPTPVSPPSSDSPEPPDFGLQYRAPNASQQATQAGSRLMEVRHRRLTSRVWSRVLAWFRSA